MVIRRLTVAFALSALASLAVAAPAFAHAELTGSNPAKGASMATAPKQVQLTFNEAVSPKSITVTGPQNATWTVGQISVEGPVVTVPVQPVGPAGDYTITYTVLSDDGDDVTGTVPFTLTGPATPPITTTTAASSANTAASNGGGGGVPAWVWIVIALAVVAAAGGLVLVRMRGRQGTADR
jgi:methionine-rich copper-binding protein CopC